MSTVVGQLVGKMNANRIATRTIFGEKMAALITARRACDQIAYSLAGVPHDSANYSIKSHDMTTLFPGQLRCI